MNWLSLCITVSRKNTGTENFKNGEAQKSWKVVTKKKKKKRKPSNNLPNHIPPFLWQSRFCILFDTGSIKRLWKGKDICADGWLEHNSTQGQIKRMTIAYRDLRNNHYNASYVYDSRKWSFEGRAGANKTGEK